MSRSGLILKNATRGKISHRLLIGYGSSDSLNPEMSIGFFVSYYDWIGTSVHKSDLHLGPFSTRGEAEMMKNAFEETQSSKD